MSYYTATFLVGAHRFGVPFPKLQRFSQIFWALHIHCSQCEKKILGFLFICLFTKLQRQMQIIVFRNSAVKPKHVLFENELFLCKMLDRFLADIPLYIKSPEEKLCKVLEKELKTHIPVGLKFVFEKIKFKVLHYIQPDLVRQRPGLSKDQISMFQSLAINYFISSIVTQPCYYLFHLKYCHTF